jgi:hypothetical protein
MRAAAEVEKLARALHADSSRLAALEALEPHDIRALRHAVTDALLEADSHHFGRVADAAKALPAAVAAKLAEKALGPLLAARVAAMIDLDRALDLVGRLSPGFLADVALELDPRQAHDLLAALPARPIALAAAELDRRGEHVAMSMFVGHLSHDALRETVAILTDDALLRIGYLLEAPDRLETVFGFLDDERIAAIVRLTAEQDRWTELTGITDELGPLQQRRVAALLRAAA